MRTLSKITLIIATLPALLYFAGQPAIALQTTLHAHTSQLEAFK